MGALTRWLLANVESVRRDFQMALETPTDPKLRGGGPTGSAENADGQPAVTCSAWLGVAFFFIWRPLRPFLVHAATRRTMRSSERLATRRNATP